MQTTKKFGLSDKLGYLFGDFGNDFTFILSTMFLMKFYTDVMGVSGGLVGTMMMLARFLDAFTDVAMGEIVDRSRPGKRGKFLPWIGRMCGPVAVASFLMYASWFRNMPMGFKIFWMFFTYILWGSVFYTSINIPYGAMASAVSSEPRDRATLSNFRTIGASLAATIIGVVLPLVVYYKDEEGNSVLSGTNMMLAALVCSIAAVVCYLLCLFLTTERVKVPQKTEKFSLKELLVSLGHNKPLIGIIVSSVCMLMAQLTLQGMAAYIYPNYFGNVAAQSASSFVGVVITLFCAIFTVKLSEKLGRKELGVIAAVFSGIVLVVTYFLHTKNAWVFVGMFGIAYIGLAVFSLITWAMITDVIDDTEVQLGERSDGTIYAVYSFARKLGQALSSGLSGFLLSAIGYSQATAFDEGVVNGIYMITCLVPALGFFLLALSLQFLYPLGRLRVEENAKTLAKKKR
ncbi:MAG: glycoside-pentoside-hexuronide (GPH):cation symporter [Lachnospiraceae bacterium]|nr:glycoside-pentoside-hexuronide (GPH):cation symporter [Lachnospiraceae bacterium]